MAKALVYQSECNKKLNNHDQARSDLESAYDLSRLPEIKNKLEAMLNEA